jgi:hypothetical protein
MAVGKKRQAALYLNVDLEIRSRSDLRPLSETLDGRLFVLYVGKAGRDFLLALELPGLSLPPDRAVARLARTISSLPPAMRRHWQKAHDRVFDVGFERTSRDGVFSFGLDRKTVATAAKLGARIAFSLYPHEGKTTRS